MGAAVLYKMGNSVPDGLECLKLHVLKHGHDHAALHAAGAGTISDVQLRIRPLIVPPNLDRIVHAN
jgi:hypothetical protein